MSAYSLLDEIYQMVHRSEPGVRMVSAVGCISGGIALLNRPNLFDLENIYSPLVAVPEWSLGFLGMTLGILLSILPRNHWRRKALFGAGAWWLFWAMVVSYTAGFGLFSSTLWALYFACVLEFWHTSVPAQIPKRNG